MGRRPMSSTRVLACCARWHRRWKAIRLRRSTRSWKESGTLPAPSTASAWPTASCIRRRELDMPKISIDPITRLEGHGKIEIFLDEAGNVRNTYFQIPELRGFERFVVGRPIEEMALITNRICGVCPEAHNMAASKAADMVYKVDPPRTGKMLRELLYSAFYCADHTTHFYALGGPDFVMGPDAPVAERNILGV